MNRTTIRRTASAALATALLAVAATFGAAPAHAAATVVELVVTPDHPTIAGQCYGPTTYPEVTVTPQFPAGAEIETVTYYLTPPTGDAEALVVDHGWVPFRFTPDNGGKYTVTLEASSTVGGLYTGETIVEVWYVTPSCRPPVSVALVQAPEPVTLPAKAAFRLQASEAGTPLVGSPQWLIEAPDGVTVTYTGSPAAGLFDYEVTAAAAGTYDLTVSYVDYNGPTHFTVQTVFAAATDAGSLIQRLVSALVALLNQLLAILRR